LRRLAVEFRPELVVNCAGFTQVDRCESEPGRAMAVNGDGVRNVLAAAGAVGARAVHVSTDYVFDGEGREPYREDAALAPRSAYGASKAAGERHARAAEGALVVRTSWLFGPGGPNFVATMLSLVEAGRLPLRVVDDQVGCPTYAPYLAAAILDLAARGAAGVVHYCNRDAVSWCGFAREIVRLAAPAAEVVAVSTAEFPRPARRPSYSVLDVGRCEAILGRRVEPWLLGLAEYLNHLRRRTS
jgi:dTDP-4-dehydrorhamnose reductase